MSSEDRRPLVGSLLDDGFEDSVGNILRRSRTVSVRSEQQVQRDEQRRQSIAENRSRHRRRLQQQGDSNTGDNNEDAILPADPISRAEAAAAAAAERTAGRGRGDGEEGDSSPSSGDDLGLTGISGSFLCHPRALCHRLIALFLMSMIGFGSYFCYDNPGALQNEIVETMHVSTARFSLLYSWYSTPNIVLPIIGGTLIDRVFGMRLATILFAGIIVVGQAVFAVGAFQNHFGTMEGARFIFGIGGESLAVAQNTYAVAWFKEKEINMVFGFQLAVARAGSSVNFWTVGRIFHWLRSHFHIDGHHALGWTLALCCSTCIASFLCAIVLAWQDKRKERLTSNKTELGDEDKPRLKDMFLLPAKFWILSVVCMTYYSAVFPFVSLGQVFLIKKYSYSMSEANFYISLIYVMSAPLSPIMGFMIDKWGRNIAFCFVAIVGTLIAHLLFAFTFLDPLYGIIVLGFGYSLLASALWPIVALIVPENTLGTAYGVMQALQNGGMALQTMLAGMVVDEKGYMWLELFFSANLAVAVALTVFMWVLDQNDDGYLNMSVGQREAFKEAKRLKKEEEERRKHQSNPNRPRDHNELRRRYLSRIGAALPAHLGLGRNAVVNANLVVSPNSPMVVASSVPDAP